MVEIVERQIESEKNKFELQEQRFLWGKAHAEVEDSRLNCTQFLAERIQSFVERKHDLNKKRFALEVKTREKINRVEK